MAKPEIVQIRDVFGGHITTAAKLREALELVTPSDSVFRNAFADAKVSNARLARYYLRSLESVARVEPEPWFIPQDDKSIVNLEHVLPKKPESNWPEFSDDDVKLLNTRLGNQALMLASQNAAIKSSSFFDKREVYAASPYVLTSQIGSLEEWSAAAIEDRQTKLSLLAIKAWPIS